MLEQLTHCALAATRRGQEQGVWQDVSRRFSQLPENCVLLGLLDDRSPAFWALGDKPLVVLGDAPADNTALLRLAAYSATRTTSGLGTVIVASAPREWADFPGVFTLTQLPSLITALQAWYPGKKNIQRLLLILDGVTDDWPDVVSLLAGDRLPGITVLLSTRPTLPVANQLRAIQGRAVKNLKMPSGAFFSGTLPGPQLIYGQGAFDGLAAGKFVLRSQSKWVRISTIGGIA
ncbi:hypothetical protein GW781_00990 [bacterium]|nr:hypothetical protein [bacterium]